MPPVQLPFRCEEATNLMAAYLADAARLQALTPPQLRVVELLPGVSAVGIACIEYRDTTLGPYGEVGLSWPVVRAEAGVPRLLSRLPVLPLLFGDRWPGLGWWVHQLPVTTARARDAGRTVWGYPKFLADITFRWDGATRVCRLAEGGRDILELSADTRLLARPQAFSQRTFTVLAGELRSTHISFEGTGGGRYAFTRSRLTLGDHPLGQGLRDLGLHAERAVNVQWFPVWRAVLPGPDPIP